VNKSRLECNKFDNTKFEKEELVTELMIIAREELEHLQMDDLISKGLSLGRERKDHYVNELFKFMKKDGV
jgi:tRNA-(ms[2]io[6]A)-hydroxylase